MFMMQREEEEVLCEGTGDEQKTINLKKTVENFA